MIIIPTSKPQNYYDYTGTPDKVIEPGNKEHLVKENELKFNMFSGWVQSPIYKELNDITLPKKYNKKNHIYIYNPLHTLSDKWGMTEFKIVGYTKKNSDKRVLAICEDTHPKAIFKLIYIEVVGTIDGVKAIDCGHVYNTTNDNYNKAKIGESYKGYRNSKWIKLDKAEYDFSGIYSENK